MRILGVDPGYGILGWAVIDSEMKMVDYGSIETPKEMEFDERVFALYNDLNSVIKYYKPDCAAIEKLFFSKNTTTALKVASIIGVVVLLFRQHALSYEEFTPVQVKQAIAGYGRAEKKQVQTMMQKIFNLKEIPTPDDAADAIGIAFCRALTCKGKY